MGDEQDKIELRPPQAQSQKVNSATSHSIKTPNPQNPYYVLAAMSHNSSLISHLIRGRRIIQMRNRTARHLVEKGATPEAASMLAAERTKVRWKRLKNFSLLGHFNSARNESKILEASTATDLFPPTSQRGKRRRRRSPSDGEGRRHWRRRRRNYSQVQSKCSTLLYTLKIL